MRSMQIFIKRINDCHVLIFDIKIKNISVTSDAFRIAGFRDNGNSLLNSPAKTYLCRSSCVFGSQNTHDIVVKIGASCQRGISLYLNTKSFTVFDQFGWITQGMTFNLIYSRDNSGNFTELFQMPDVKIADADTQSTPGFQDFFQFFPGAQVAARNWPVNQAEINIAELQTVKTAGKSTLNITQPLGCVPRSCW